MQVVYLTGERVYLRSLVEEDVDRATAWFDSSFPINATRAKAFVDEQPFLWWTQEDFTLVVARKEDDEPVGGVKLSISDHRIATLHFHIAPTLPDADILRADAVRVVVPWLEDDHEFMVVRVHVPADLTETIAAVEELGMQPSVRLREFVARGGTRVDEIIYEALNPRWEVRHA